MSRFNSGFVFSILIVVLGTGILVFGANCKRSAKTDENGMMGMMMGMMKRMPKTGLKPDELPEPTSIEAKTYVQYCSPCHVLPNPRMHSAEEWIEVVERMYLRMKMMSMTEGSEGSIGFGIMRGMMERMMEVGEITEAEKSIILGYLQQNALDILTEEEIQAFKSREAEIFKQVCSQCHDLPNPKLFPVMKWPEIIAKMKESMKEMEFPVMNYEEEKAILEFLKKNAQT